jgi:hypothetical protein
MKMLAVAERSLSDLFKCDLRPLNPSFLEWKFNGSHDAPEFEI